MAVKKATKISFAIAELKRLRNEVTVVINDLEALEPQRKKPNTDKMFMIDPRTGKKVKVNIRARTSQ